MTAANNADTDNNGIPDGEEDSDGDGLINLMDAGPGEIAMDWKRVFKPNFVFVPLDEVPTAVRNDDWEGPHILNDKGAVVFDSGIWEAGTWTGSMPGLL